MTEKYKNAVTVSLKSKILWNIEKVSGFIKVIPGWVPANLITLFRALLLVPIFLAYQNENWGWMVGLYLLAWFTDVLDGLHARYRGQISRFGALFDPAVDKVFVVVVLFIAAPGRLSIYVIRTTVGVEIAIILMTILLMLLSKVTRRKFQARANAWGKFKMLLQGLALAGLLIGFNTAWLWNAAEITLWCAALLALLSIAFYIRSAQRVRLDLSWLSSVRY